ncbi:hypothetical protein [Tateyamaria sp.]|uniref:hypothetical protein n=1 Tax=Tateyamaria sp. TaxID=1929288 RepID=UPI00329ED129
MLATERLQDVLMHVNISISRGTSNVIDVLGYATDGKSSKGFFKLLNLLTDCIEEVSSCIFRREGRREHFIQSLVEIRDALLKSVSIGNDEMMSWVSGAYPKVSVIAAAVSEAMDQEVYELDREAFATHTDSLISDVNEWPISEYAKRSLLLSLSMIKKQALAEQIAFSDAELRRGIKSAVASFAIEFAELDKEFETRWEKVKRWAKYGFAGSSVPLGLTADATTIAGLLPKP